LKMGFAPQHVRLLTSGFEAETVEITAEERARKRRELGIAPEQIVIANVARLYPEKAQDFLLRSFAKIVQQAPQARLWIAGIGPLEDNLRQLVRQLGLGDAVTFVGFVRDLPSLLSLVDILVNPSTSEGVSLAVCSGMAAGLPVVATEVGGLPEVIHHGKTGLLVPVGDTNAFNESVLSLIGDPKQRQVLGTAAQKFMLEEYSLGAAVARVERVYYEVLGRCASEYS